jgi:hypothetical protein
VDEKLNYKFKSQISFRALQNTVKYGANLDSLNIFTSSFFLNPASVNLSNFLFYNNVSSTDNLEESYENIKNLKLLNFLNFKNTTFSSLNTSLPFSYTTVLDSFRADFEENN